MDDVSFAVLALALTVLGGIYTWYAYQRRGLATALRGAGLTLLPVAAYLTDTLRMFARIFDAVGDWATRLVFSPTVWLGVIVAGLAVVLFGAGRFLEGRGDTPARASKRRQRASGDSAGAVEAPTRGKRTEPVVDEDLDEIQAILRKRGIS